MAKKKSRITYEALTSSQGNIDIVFGIYQSPFGWCVIGTAKRGICHVSFLDTKSETEARKRMALEWPEAKLVRNDAQIKKIAAAIFLPKKSSHPLHLLMKGTSFQLKVWEALLSIPSGKTVSYKDIAGIAGSPKAVRAVGTACGRNSIGFVIPCHRVLTSAGSVGGYRWGVSRKRAILAWESIRVV